MEYGTDFRDFGAFVCPVFCFAGFHRDGFFMDLACGSGTFLGDRSRAQVYCSSFDRDRKRTENRSDHSFCDRASGICDCRRVYRQPDVRRTEGGSGLYNRPRGTGAWRKTEQSTEAASGEGGTGVGTLREADPAFVRRTGRRREHYGSRVYEAIFGGKGYSGG